MKKIMVLALIAQFGIMFAVLYVAWHFVSKWW